MPALGAYVALLLGLASEEDPQQAALGGAVLVGLLHTYVHLALPRWTFLRQTPISGSRVFVWLLVPLLLVLVPAAGIYGSRLAGSEPDSRFAARPSTWRAQTEYQVSCLVTPLPLRRMLARSNVLPREVSVLDTRGAPRVPLTAAASILAWSVVAFWPSGIELTIRALSHYGVALAGGAVLLCLLLVALHRALSRANTGTVEGL